MANQQKPPTTHPENKAPTGDTVIGAPPAPARGTTPPLPSTHPTDGNPLPPPPGAAGDVRQPYPNAPSPGMTDSPPQALQTPNTPEDPTFPGARYRGNDVGQGDARARALATEAIDVNRSLMHYDEQNGTHVIVRSKRDRFRRAGMSFTRKWTAIDTRDITPNQLEALLVEPELEVQRVSEGTARDLIQTQDMAGTDQSEYAAVSKAHLIAEISRMKEDNAGLRAKIAQLEARAADHAPKQGETLATDGSRSPLPLPENGRKR